MFMEHPAAPPSAETETETGAGALPIPRATLEEMERNRARALELYAQSFDMLEEARKFARLAAISGKAGDGASTAEPDKFSDHARDAIAPRWGGDRTDKRRADFIKEMTQQTDRAMWAHIIRATDLERLMDKQARDEFRNSLQQDPPPAIADNVRATLSAMVEDADTIFRRGIANAFAKLDRRFRSHDGFKIGARVVLAGAFSESGGWNHYARQDETLRDIERTFCVLDGKPQPERAAGICGLIDAQGYFSKQWTVEGDYFRVRRFKNGNAHLWFTRDDLVRKVNRLLADYYGEAIGEGSDVADVSAMGPGYHLTPARNFGLFETSEETAAHLFERFGHFEGMTVLEPSAGRGALADGVKRRGAASVHCVEIQHELAATLRQKGHRVTEGDFLQMTPAGLGMFDAIVMNPPFDLGRDCDHVRHALQFLKPGGVLLAIMASGTEFREDKRTASFRALVEKQEKLSRWDHRGFFHDLPEGSFKHAGTMVNTVTLALRKPA